MWRCTLTALQCTYAHANTSAHTEHAQTHMHTRTYEHAQARTHARANAHTCTHASTHAIVHTSAHTSMHERTQINLIKFLQCSRFQSFFNGASNVRCYLACSELHAHMPVLCAGHVLKMRRPQRKLPPVQPRGAPPNQSRPSNACHE